MASVRINFVKPESENLTKLHIWESSTQTGTYSEIEVVDDIGTYPDYISFYTTDLAASVSDWFAIEWEDDKGAKTELSAPIQGNTTTVPGEITSRVLLRDPSISETIAVQESEIVAENYFGVEDVYGIDADTVTNSIYGGLTYLALARIYITDLLVGGSMQSYTAGIVAQQQGSASKSLDNIKKLIELANELLGRNYSIILQMKEIDPITGFAAFEIDASRLLVELV